MLGTPQWDGGKTMAEMTRVEAAAVLDAMIFGIYPDDDITIEKIEMEAVRFAIAALRGPQPDPETGLMKCGCGGIPEFREDKTEPKFGIYTVMCSKCNIRLSGYTNRIDFLKQDWNRAMGYKVPE